MEKDLLQNSAVQTHLLGFKPGYDDNELFNDFAASSTSLLNTSAATPECMPFPGFLAHISSIFCHSF